MQIGELSGGSLPDLLRCHVGRGFAERFNGPQRSRLAAGAIQKPLMSLDIEVLRRVLLHIEEFNALPSDAANDDHIRQQIEHAYEGRLIDGIERSSRTGYLLSKPSLTTTGRQFVAKARNAGTWGRAIVSIAWAGRDSTLSNFIYALNKAAG